MLGLSSKSSFGIDIGTQTIKLTEVKKKGGKYHLVNYVTWRDPLEDVVQEKGGARNSSSELIANILNNMIQQAKMNIQSVYLAIPSYLAFSAPVEFPIMSNEELVSAVNMQARQHIPVPIEDVQVDWLNLGVSSDQKTIHVLLMAVPNTVISKYLKIAELAGIEIEGFELDIFSQMRATDMSSSPACLVDFGARSSSVGIFDEKQRLSLLRSFDVGGNHITNNIASAAGIPVEQAEKMKIQFGVGGESEEVTTGFDMTFRRTIIRDLVRAIQEYERSTQAEMNNIILIGGMSHMKGLESYMKQCLVSEHPSYERIQVSIGKPTPSVVVPSDFTSLFESTVWQEISLSLGIALK